MPLNMHYCHLMIIYFFLSAVTGAPKGGSNKKHHLTVHDLSPGELEDYNEAFAVFDHDGSGKISKDELKKTLELLGEKHKADVKDMIKQFDTNGDGEIDFDEFVAMMTQNSLDPEKEVEEVFKRFDRNHDGFIDKGELKQVYVKVYNQHLNDHELDKMITALDVDGDGKIDKKEFAHLLDNKSHATEGEGGHDQKGHAEGGHKKDHGGGSQHGGSHMKSPSKKHDKSAKESPKQHKA